MKSVGVTEAQQEAGDTILQVQTCLCQRSPPSPVPCLMMP